MTRLHLLGQTQQEISGKLKEMFPEAKGIGQRSIAYFLEKNGKLPISSKNSKAKQESLSSFQASIQTDAEKGVVIEGLEVRHEMINGEPWWYAMDICKVLDLTDVSKAVERVPDDEKMTRTLYVSSKNRQIWLLSEFGLYDLILRSNKPEAKRFGSLR